MTLKDYLAREGIGFSAFAALIGAGHARTVERYAKGQRVPDGTMMRRIVEVTSGDVTPNDFFDLTPSPPADASLPAAEAA